MKQFKYDSNGLNELAIAVMEQAHEDLGYYPNSNNPKTLKKAENIRTDAKNFLAAMQERYGNA